MAKKRESTSFDIPKLSVSSVRHVEVPVFDVDRKKILTD